MNSFRKILGVVLSIVMCITVLSFTTFADSFNPEIKISARFDEKGEKIIAAVVTSQNCGAISGTVNFSSNLEFDSVASEFVEENNDVKYTKISDTSLRFVILANDLENGNNHWVDLHFNIKSTGDVTFTLSDVDVCDINENLVENSLAIKGATLTLTDNQLRTLGSQYREQKPALRFGAKLERNIADNSLGDTNKVAIRCGFIAGFEYKIGEGVEISATDFDSKTGGFSKVTKGAIKKQAKYCLKNENDYIIYTYAITGITDTSTTNTPAGQKYVKDLPIVARSYVVYKNADGSYGIDYGAQITKSFADVKAVSNLIDGSLGYEG